MTTIGIERTAIWNVNTAVGLEQSAEWSVGTASSIDVLSPCYDDGRCGPFRWIEIDFMVEGESRISWSLRDSFQAPTPYAFQLQVGESANPYADDWQDVGPALENTFTITDPVRRAFGKQLTTHYRVKLTDVNDQVYYSQPATVLGRLDFRSWLNVREIIRQIKLGQRMGPGGVSGLLLKKKRSGPKCPQCLDPFTGEVLNSKCDICNGTRFIGGYYRAMPCQYNDPTPIKIDEQRSQGPEGWSAVTAVRGQFLGSPMLATGDIWVDAASDLRYYVETVEVENQYNGVPVTLRCELFQLPFSHQAYSIPLESA